MYLDIVIAYSLGIVLFMVWAVINIYLAQKYVKSPWLILPDLTLHQNVFRYFHPFLKRVCGLMHLLFGYHRQYQIFSAMAPEMGS